VAKLTLAQLERHLFAAADILRGTAPGPADSQGHGLPAGGPGAAFEVRLPACGESPGGRREAYVGPAVNFLRHASET
jgi:hypothetical protein